MASWNDRDGGMAGMARAAELAGDDLVLGYFPQGRLNPYQMLLYSRADRHGVHPVALRTPDEIASIEIATRMGRRAVLHIHWTAPILEEAATEEDARTRATAFLALLDRLTDRGIRIAWTVHNVLPHDCPYPAAEVVLRQGLADRAAVIHVMNPATIEAVLPHYSLPAARTILVRHPSYRGAHPEYPDRAAARRMLGFRPRDLVVTFLGVLKPYKGLVDLAEALEAAGEADPYMAAVVAGSGQIEEPAGLERLGRVPRLDLITRPTDAGDVTTILRASDVMVLPYLTTLNSGAALLAATFGLPIVAPRLGPFVEMLEAGLGIGYDAGGGPAALTQALGEARSFVAAFDPAMALEYAGRFDPEEVSDAFFSGLLGALDSTSGEDAPV
jgi:glycosyltransferase involved in cell wall biosynthesis